MKKMETTTAANAVTTKVKVKTLVALAGVKHALHLGEEMLEFRSSLDVLHTAVDNLPMTHEQPDFYKSSAVRSTFRAAVREALDILWLTHHLGVTKSLSVRVSTPVEDDGLTLPELETIMRVPSYRDEEVSHQRTLLRDVLKYRDVLTIDRALETLEIARKHSLLVMLYDEWVAHQVGRGRDRNDYVTNIQQHLTEVYAGWVRTFGATRLDPNFNSEWPVYQEMANWYAFPGLKKELEAWGGTPKAKWYTDSSGFVHRQVV